WGDPMLVLPFGRQWKEAHAAGVSEAEHVYPGQPELGHHVIGCLNEAEFDVAHSRTLAPGQSLGHTFDFVCRRIMRGARVPQLPVLLNTYYAPNRPSATRCYALGRALRQAVDSWESDLTVALIASGGLTHTVLDQSMDQAILEGMRNRDERALTRFPESVFVDGTSEIKAWIVLAGAMEADPREMQLIDYVPCYRSVAGTGCGMGFAYWE
ncbi:MAG: protocatechuate 3,4-dioxygenase, partial [Chloroflexi bacterium]|nr:protocatechuate 3,4-dioxygenase [Chloroflexota bacterium]